MVMSRGEKIPEYDPGYSRRWMFHFPMRIWIVDFIVGVFGLFNYNHPSILVNVQVETEKKIKDRTFRLSVIKLQF